MSPRTQEINAADIIERLYYDAEVHGSIVWTFDAGFRWELLIGAGSHGGDARTFVECANQMADAATQAVPEGTFAQWWRGRPTHLAPKRVPPCEYCGLERNDVSRYGCSHAVCGDCRSNHRHACDRPGRDTIS